MKEGKSSEKIVRKTKEKKKLIKKNPKYYDNLWVQFNLKIHRAGKNGCASYYNSEALT